MKITSRVQRGDLKGAIQIPHRHADGLYVVSPTKYSSDYVRVGDLRSVANAAAAGLRVRMKADAQKVAGLVEPDSILIDGLSVREWHVAIAVPERGNKGE